jgi:hypothetical protein
VQIVVVHRTFAAAPPKTCDILQSVAQISVNVGSMLGNRANPRPSVQHAAHEALIDLSRLRRSDAAPASQCRARIDLDLPAHPLAAGWLQLSALADLFGLCRRGDRALWAVGRRMDDLGAAAALPALGDVGDRQRAAHKTAGRAMVSAVAIWPMAWCQYALKNPLHPFEASSQCAVLPWAFSAQTIGNLWAEWTPAGEAGGDAAELPEAEIRPMGRPQLARDRRRAA